MSLSSTQTSPSIRRRRRARGYTAIEVLMAMTVFAVGAASVIAMQRASVQGNVDARKLDTANAIARDWVERLRRDAMLWTQGGPSGLNQTQYLSQTAKYFTSSWVMPDTLCPAGTPPDGLCPAFDILGRDLDSTQYKDAAFCVNIRMDTLASPDAGAELIRAEVRVFWPRQLTQSTKSPVSTANGFCDPSSVGNVDGPSGTNGPAIYHYVYTSTMLRMTPLGE